MKNKKIILFLILGLFFYAGPIFALTCPPGFTEYAGVCVPNNTSLPDPGGRDPVAEVIVNIMEWLLRIVGFIAIIAFVISGMQYMLAAGNQNIMEMGKRNMMWSIVGVVVALIGLTILNTIFNLLS